jgi:hypothetical protein
MCATHQKMVILTRTSIYNGAMGRIQDLPPDMWTTHRRFKCARIDTNILLTLGEEGLLLS